MTINKLKFNKQFFSFVATYFIGSWGIVQFVDWICNRYNFNTNWTDIIGLVAILILPSILIFSWLQSDDANIFKKQKIFYALNAALLLFTVIPLSQGYSLTSTTEKIIITNEDGKKEEVEISKRAYIRQIAFLPFQNTNKQDWLAFAFPALIARDISQCKRFNAINPLNFKPEIDNLEYEIKDAVPQNVKNKLMNDKFADYMVSGSIDKINKTTFKYNLELFSGKLSKIMFSTKGQSNDIFALTDSLSLILNEQIFSNDLKIKTDTYKDIPTKEIYSFDEKALANYFKASVAYYNSNFSVVLDLLNDALKIDKKFVEAYYLRGIMNFSNGDITQGRADVETALQLSNSVSEYQQRKIKTNYYLYSGNYNKTKDFLRMWTQIHPEDNYPFKMLLQRLQAEKEIDKAIEIGLQAEKAGHKSIFLFQMATLYTIKKDTVKVNEYLEAYQKAFKEDTEFRLKIGQIYYRQGNFMEAAQQYNDYKTLNPLDPIVNVKLSNCYFQVGNFEEAKLLLEEARSRAKNFSDSVQIFTALERYYTERGQIKLAIEHLNQRWAFSEKYYPPITNTTMKAGVLPSQLYYFIGDVATPKKYIETAIKSMGPEGKEYGYGFWLNYYFIQERGKEFDECLKNYKSAIKSNISEGMFKALDGYSKKFSGQYEEAIAILEEVTESSATNGSANYHLNDSYRLNKQYDKAVLGFKTSLEKHPFSGSLLLKYAQSLNDNNQVTEARAVLEKIMKIWENADPEYIEYQEALAFSKQINLAD